MRNESAGKADGEMVGAESTALLSSEIFTPYSQLPTHSFLLTSSYSQLPRVHHSGLFLPSDGPQLPRCQPPTEDASTWFHRYR